MKEMKNYTRLGMFLLIAVLSAVSVLAVDLPSFKVLKGTTKSSQAFNVPSAGTLTVDVKVRVAGVFGIAPGESKYVAQLIAPNGDQTDIGGRSPGSSFETIRLSTTVTCAQTGAWKIIVTNPAQINKQDGDVEFPAFSVPQLDSSTINLPAFDVNRGTGETRAIPNGKDPRAPGGRMTITADWDSLCFPDPAGCRGRLVLMRNGEAYRPADGGRSVVGYPNNALFGGANPKASVSVYVAPGDVSGTWTLLVQATSAGSITNVRPTVKFTEGCN